jgi:pyruvate kinase
LYLKKNHSNIIAKKSKKSNTFRMKSEILNKKVRIVATLGLASYEKPIIKKLAIEGVNVFRINMSHAKEADVRRIIGFIREIEQELKTPLAIMGDLQGPKIRLGEVAEGSMLENGKTLTITKKTILGSSSQISVSFPDLLDSLKIGAQIYLGDSEAKLEVVEKNKDGDIEALVQAGGPIRSRMGFAAQGIALPEFVFTEKDKADLAILVKNKADAIAISFIQNHKDLAYVRSLLPKNNQPLIVSKIETEKAVEDIDAIIDASDVVMVARGDLGISIPLPRLPHVQKHIIAACRQKAVPVITATQMLESMTKNIMPTRAEVTDVANAIFDGTDAVMLSGETASGKYPVETVRVMAQIAAESQEHTDAGQCPTTEEVGNAVAYEAVALAACVNAKLIIAFTASGKTAQAVASHRPMQEIIAASFDHKTLRKLCFTWGIAGLENTPLKNLDDMVAQARAIAKSQKVVPMEKKDPYVIVAGIPFGGNATTNMVLVQNY